MTLLQFLLSGLTSALFQTYFQGFLHGTKVHLQSECLRQFAGRELGQAGSYIQKGYARALRNYRFNRLLEGGRLPLGLSRLPSLSHNFTFDATKIAITILDPGLNCPKQSKPQTDEDCVNDQSERSGKSNPCPIFYLFLLVFLFAMFYLTEVDAAR